MEKVFTKWHKLISQYAAQSTVYKNILIDHLNQQPNKRKKQMAIQLISNFSELSDERLNQTLMDLDEKAADIENEIEVRYGYISLSNQVQDKKIKPIRLKRKKCTDVIVISSVSLLFKKQYTHIFLRTKNRHRRNREALTTSRLFVAPRERKRPMS